MIEVRRQKAIKNDPICYLAAYRVFTGNGLGDQLHLIKSPTLIMTGENDIGSSPRMSKFMHDQIAGSVLHILPRFKHLLLLECSTQVAGSIDPFLSFHCPH